MEKVCQTFPNKEQVSGDLKLFDMGLKPSFVTELLTKKKN